MSEASAKTLEKAKARRESNSNSELGKPFRWRRLLAILIIFFLLIYGISLILLNTSWAKNKLTNRLHSKSNSDWEVGSVVWIPFGDIELNNLETTMGEGGIKINSLAVKPSWSGLFFGSFELMEATVTEADVDLDLQWIRDNLSNNEEIIIPPKQALSTKPQSQVRPPKPKESKTNNNPVKPTKKPLPKPVMEEKPELGDLPNRWLKVKKMNLTLRNGEHVIEQISDLSASIPIAGKPVDGGISFKYLGDNHSQKVSWDGDKLSAEEAAGELFGLRYQWKVACKTSQPGMPFAFRFIVPQQQLNHTYDKPNAHFNISSDKIAANFIIKGSLRNLKTWRGILNAVSEKTTITENQKTHKRMDFDHTRLVGTIANGVLHVPVAEAIGHKISILANGSVHKNLYSYGVVRWITNNESRGFFEKVYHGTKFINIDRSRYHLLFPLDTPDRRYCDFYLDGKVNDLEIRHNRSDRWQSLNKVVKKLWDFKNRELQEDGLLEAD